MQSSGDCKGVLSGLQRLCCEIKIFVTEDRAMGPAKETVFFSFFFLNPRTGRECDISVRGYEKCKSAIFFPYKL